MLVDSTVQSHVGNANSHNLEPTASGLTGKGFPVQRDIAIMRTDIVGLDSEATLATVSCQVLPSTPHRSRILINWWGGRR